MPCKCGAPDGNRTRVSSLGSWRSAIELQMHLPVNHTRKQELFVEKRSALPEETVQADIFHLHFSQKALCEL